MPPAPAEPPHRRRTPPLPAALCAAAILWLGLRLWDGLGFLSFADEATHVLGGRMLDRGAILYRDFVDTHGPLVFALAQMHGVLFGWAHDNAVRIWPALFALAALCSMAVSPLPRTALSRCCLLLLWSGLLSILWLKQGLFLFSFYPLGGALASIPLGGLLPGGCAGRWPGRAHAALSGLCCALLAALAYSFLPCVALFAAATCWAALADRRRRVLAWFAAGMLCGLAAAALWLRRFADLHGLLAFHFAENQVVYARHIGFSALHFVASLVPDAAPSARAQTLGVLCVALSPPLFLLGGGQRGPFALTVLGVLSLNARGAASFQDGSFLCAAVSLLSLSAAHAAGRLRPGRAATLAAPGCAAAVAAAALFLRPAPLLPFDLPAATVAAMPRWPIGDRSEAPFFAEIRRHAGPDQPILALPYQPQLYLLADRMPMPGFYAWFPWDQEDSLDPPRFGRRRDLCAALAASPPPVIVVDRTPFWNHPVWSIVPCLAALLRNRYAEETRFDDPHGRLFIRRDPGR